MASTKMDQKAARLPRKDGEISWQKRLIQIKAYELETEVKQRIVRRNDISLSISVRRIPVDDAAT